jgi:type II secretory ATPase GspE/PulE/Tfp pilus assembly ATPase PilB-like protein
MSGYSGRIGLYEMLPITRGVRAALMAGAGEAAITAAAMGEGFRSLQRLGVEAAVAGLTTPAELLRTLSIDAESLSAV